MAHTGAQPLTMVIHFINAMLACSAVVKTRRFLPHTNFAYSDPPLLQHIQLFWFYWFGMQMEESRMSLFIVDIHKNQP